MATQTNKELFVGGIERVLKEQRHVDVRLKAGDSDETGSPISVHKLVLSARSEVFNKMLESDEIKASGKLETITLSEMTHIELEALIEIIYSDGSMLSAKGKQYVRSLYHAADKYEIPHLRDLCRNQLIASLNSTNALDYLELAQIPFDKALNDAALECIQTNIIVISKSAAFKVFIVNHSNLTLEIVRGYVASGKSCISCGCFCHYSGRGY